MIKRRRIEVSNPLRVLGLAVAIALVPIGASCRYLPGERKRNIWRRTRPSPPRVRPTKLSVTLPHRPHASDQLRHEFYRPRLRF